MNRGLEAVELCQVIVIIEWCAVVICSGGGGA